MIRMLAVFAVVTALLSPARAAENHAILIGASTYQNLDERFWLVGPANDVGLVRTYLTSNPHVTFAPENITVLADGVDGARAPTLAAIRASMADWPEAATVPKLLF